jgi:hypothetical protein
MGLLLLLATLSTSFVAVKLDEDSSKASFYVIQVFSNEALSHSSVAYSCGLMKVCVGLVVAPYCDAE